jgi:chromosome segregation ATPase
MRGQKDEMGSLCEKLKEDLREQVTEKQKIIALEEQLRGSIAELKAQLARESEENHKLLVDAEKAFAAEQRAIGKAEELAKAQAGLQNALDLVKRELHDAKGSITSLTGEREMLKAQALALKDKITALDVALKETDGNLNDARTELAKAYGMHDALRTEFLAQSSELKDIQQQFLTNANMMAQAKGQLIELKSHLETAQKKISTQASDLDDAQAKISELNTKLLQIDKLKGQLAECKNEVETMQKLLKQLQGDKDRLASEIERLNGVLAEKEKLEAQILALREALERKEVLVNKVREDKQEALKDAEKWKGTYQEKCNELATCAQDLELAIKEREAAQQSETKAITQLQELQRKHEEKVEDAKAAHAAKRQLTSNLATAKTQMEGVRYSYTAHCVFTCNREPFAD